MKNGIPLIYWTFRTAWTLMHFVIVAAAAAALLTWALADNRAVRIWDTSKTNVLDVQQRVSNVIPWPWAMDEGGDNYSGDGNNYSGGGENRGGGGNDSGSTKRIRVSANINVRVAPSVDAKVVKVLDKGSWVKADCKVENGDRVSNGPYGPSRRWDHIVGLGYISDAYVPTNTDGLPRCR
ncbi:hypothetical protein [Nocardioides sp. HDW12B]|uniref:hypothetical protein n=1 Tax=Nocardioides sp. HDW12B TaxID=2714939 RepID=UPI00197FED42|nr:hypothetical protein [Nocardioides sp. HDW12B]